MLQGKNLSGDIANKIKKKIMTGEYAVGSQLPNEQELSESLNVSRTTIREAVKLLVSRHILEIERGKGTFVTALPGLSDDPFGLDFVPDQRLTPDLVAFRRIVEPDVCRLAAQKATDRQISEMRHIVVRMEQATSKVGFPPYDGVLIDLFTNYEIEYHILLYKMTHNIIFERMSPVISKAVVISYTSTIYREGFSFRDNTEIHRQLYLAIMDRDSELAQQIGIEHTAGFMRAL